MTSLIPFLALLACLACAASSHAASKTPADPSKKSAKPAKKVYPTFGSIERLDPALDALLANDSKLEKLADGFVWAEGPVWMKKAECLVFSDVPRNVVFQWKEGVGTTEFLFPSGYTGSVTRGGEPGSNGLTVDAQGNLVLCQHGDRRVSRLDKNGTFTPLADYYKYRRFNSPNDLVYNRKGELYFTDPPYGLEGNNKDPKKELMFNGVYLLRKDGSVTLLTDKLTFPNGIALSPDEKTLYVAVSDPAKAQYWAYDIENDGTASNGRVLFDATPMVASKKGLPDGLKVDRHGNLFATGPGGVLILSPQGKHLGTIDTGEPTANCGWGGDGSTLYITANNTLCRIKTLTKGKGF